MYAIFNYNIFADNVFLKHGMSKFGEGERVLCFHGPLLYEARCHKVNTEGEVSFILYNLNLVVLSELLVISLSNH